MNCVCLLNAYLLFYSNCVLEYSTVCTGTIIGIYCRCVWHLKANSLLITHNVSKYNTWFCYHIVKYYRITTTKGENSLEMNMNKDARKSIIFVMQLTPVYSRNLGRTSPPL